jgi:hypothetical protein
MKRINIECEFCDGTGLNKGEYEEMKMSCAAICSRCNGTGCIKFEYKKFKGRKLRDDIVKVFPNSFGFVHFSDDFEFKDGDLIHYSKYGCSYQEWLKGVFPKPVKELYCPRIYNQSLVHEILELEKKCLSSKHLYGGITSCKYYKDKAVCWEIFEKGYKS